MGYKGTDQGRCMGRGVILFADDRYRLNCGECSCSCMAVSPPITGTRAEGGAGGVVGRGQEGWGPGGPHVGARLVVAASDTLTWGERNCEGGAWFLPCKPCGDAGARNMLGKT